jgi:hypothetical protein
MTPECAHEKQLGCHVPIIPVTSGEKLVEIAKEFLGVTPEGEIAFPSPCRRGRDLILIALGRAYALGVEDGQKTQPAKPGNRLPDPKPLRYWSCDYCGDQFATFEEVQNHMKRGGP